MVQLLTNLASARVAAGRPGEAGSAIAEARQLGPAAHRFSAFLQQEHGRTRALLGDGRGAREAFERSLALGGAHTVPSSRARLFAEVVVDLVRLGDPPGGRPRAPGVTPDPGDRSFDGRCVRALWAGLAARAGRADEARETLAAVRREIEAAGWPCDSLVHQHLRWAEAGLPSGREGVPPTGIEPATL